MHRIHVSSQRRYLTSEQYQIFQLLAAGYCTSLVFILSPIQSSSRLTSIVGSHDISSSHHHLSSMVGWRSSPHRVYIFHGQIILILLRQDRSLQYLSRTRCRWAREARLHLHHLDYLLVNQNRTSGTGFTWKRLVMWSRCECWVQGKYGLPSAFWWLELSSLGWKKS